MGSKIEKTFNKAMKKDLSLIDQAICKSLSHLINIQCKKNYFLSKPKNNSLCMHYYNSSCATWYITNGYFIYC